MCLEFREPGWTSTKHLSFDNVSKEHCSSVLDVDKVCGKIVTSTRTAETDGISVCLHFKLPKISAKPLR